MTSFTPSTRQAADRDPTSHTFVPKLGYVRNDGPPTPVRHPLGGKNCGPPAGAADRSQHVLLGPGGVEHVLVWDAPASAWRPLPRLAHVATRLAWTPGYLSDAGWRYVRPHDPDGERAAAVAAISEAVDNIGSVIEAVGHGIGSAKRRPRERRQR